MMPQALLVLVLDRGLGRLFALVAAFTLVAMVLVASMLVLFTASLLGGGRTRALPTLGGSTEVTRSTQVSRPLAQPGAGEASIASDRSGARVVATARQYLGVPYVWGGSSPAGLDCSGLVWLVFRQIGLNLPRTAQQQYDATPRLSQAAAQPGDLVFFAQTYPDPHDWITHVGIYVGDGLMINAPTTGDVVRVMPAWSGFWGAHYAGAGRVVGR